MEKQFCFNYEHYAALAELSDADRELVREAERATANANAPYSKFRVGAAARLRSGKILYGSNFESEVYPAGLCAERTLMFYAQANYADDPIETLAIASDPSERECYPCGQCRQVMVDVERRQGAPMRVIMSGGGTATAAESAAYSAAAIESICRTRPARRSESRRPLSESGFSSSPPRTTVRAPRWSCAPAGSPSERAATRSRSLNRIVTIY